MSVQEFSQGPRFAIFRLHGRKSGVIIRYFPKQGPSLQGPAVPCTDCTCVKSTPALEQLKLETSNLVCMLIIASLSLRTTNCP